MKVDLLGAKYSPSAAPMDHTVVPFVGLPAISVQVNAVPPHSWTSIPRCCLYQACNATGSFALKKIPPIPVTLFIEPPKVLPETAAHTYSDHDGWRRSGTDDPDACNRRGRRGGGCPVTRRVACPGFVV